MNLIKFFALAFFAITSACTQAALIKASDFVVGTEITQLDSNTTIHLLNNINGTTEALPVSINSKGTIGAPTSNNFGGLVYDLYMSSHGLESLDDLYSRSWGFSAILMAYITPTRQLTVNGFSPFGDGFMALSFDKNGKFLEYQGINGAVKCLNTDSPSCTSGFSFGDTFYFESAAHYVVIGGMFSATYIESIDASLPEPSSLLLFVLAGATLVLRVRRHNRKKHLLR